MSGPSLYFITHPNVLVSRDTPVPRWPLSELGRQRMRQGLKQPWVRDLTAIYCSTEQKAIDGASILAEHLSLPFRQIPELGENDRSATGFLPPEEFERVADEFFARPEESVRGWERAVDAQARIVRAVKELGKTHGSIAIVSHGAVGTLLYCHLAGVPIARRWRSHLVLSVRGGSPSTSMARVALISDTHGLLRPAAMEFLRGADFIIHAGDIGDAQLLGHLAAIARVTAVRGNNDKGAWADEVPNTAVLRVGQVSVYVLHNLAELALDPAAAGLQVVVSGHSHRPSVDRRDGVLYVNPGSAGPRRFKLPISLGELEISGASVKARLHELKP